MGSGKMLKNNGIKDIIKVISSVENVLITLGLTAVVSATDAAIQKKIYGLGITTLIISNKLKLRKSQK